MNVFTYVENLMTGRETGGFRISQFARRHDQIDATLTELKNIIIKYYPAKGNNHLLTPYYSTYSVVNKIWHLIAA